MKKWQRSFFYMKSAEAYDALNLPEFSLPPPVAEKNFKYSPAESDESRIVDKVLKELLDQKFGSDDMLRTFVWRRVAPLQMRGHKNCHMSNRLDPTWLSRHQLTKGDIMKRVKAIASSEMKDEWDCNVKPFNQKCPAPQVSHLTT